MSKLVESFFKEETAPSLELRGIIVEALPIAFFDGELTEEEADDRAMTRWEDTARKRHWKIRDMQPVSINFIDGQTRVDGEIEFYASAGTLLDPENEEASIRQLEEEAMRSHFTQPKSKPVYADR